MRRSRRSSKKDKRKASVIFFLVGVAIGLTAFVFYKISAPPAPTRPTVRGARGQTPLEARGQTPSVSAIPSPSPLPIGERVRVRGQAKVAIVLDDFGYNYKNVEAVLKIKRPVTFSILPHHPYSKTISRRVYEKGYEAILHLPLEPYENDKSVKPEKITITAAMKKEEVLFALTKALESMPYAKGVSNHQGSKATENYELMKIVFTKLRLRNMYFLDSLVTSKSVCKKLAKDTGIRFGRRNIFLDNREDFEYIRTQMQQLVRKAKRSGSAIGIGHDREKTVAALAVLIPEAEKEGIEFVFLSELIR